MAKIDVHAGDFKTGKFSQYAFGGFVMATEEISWTGFKTESYSQDKVETVEVASEESVRKWGGALGWGALGGLALGPIGLIAGLFLGGKRNEVTFIVVFKDGKKFLGTTDAKTFTKIRAITF